MKKTFLKTFTVIALISAMAAGLCACSLSAVNDNPVIGKVGRITVTLNDYKNMYMGYYQYIQMGYMSPDGLNDIIKSQLKRNAVTLNQAYEQGIKVDETELEAKVQEQLESALKSVEIDASITEPDAQKEAKLKLFKKTLRKNGSSYNEYLNNLRKDTRSSMMTEGLRNKLNAEIEKNFDENKVEAYFNEEIKAIHDKYLKADGDDSTAAPENTAAPEAKPSDKPKDKFADVKAFKQGYNEYMTNGGLIPFFCPEGMFTVKHILVKFAEDPKAPGAAPDTSAPKKDKEYSKEALEKLDRIREALKEGNTTTVEDFKKLIDELGEDPGMNSEGYKEHGYLMHEGLIDSYFAGFGLYAMKLMYGEDWEPTVEEKPADTPDPAKTPEPSETPEPAGTPDPTDKPEEAKPEYEFKAYYTIKDAEGNPVKVAEVECEAGTHFIIVNDKKLAEYKEEGFSDAKGVIAGYDLNFVNDKEDHIWKNIYDYLLKKAQQDHYTEEYEVWAENTKIRMKDNYINQLAAMYGIK